MYLLPISVAALVRRFVSLSLALKSYQGVSVISATSNSGVSKYSSVGIFLHFTTSYIVIPKWYLEIHLTIVLFAMPRSRCHIGYAATPAF